MACLYIHNNTSGNPGYNFATLVNAGAKIADEAVNAISTTNSEEWSGTIVGTTTDTAYRALRHWDGISGASKSDNCFVYGTWTANASSYKSTITDLGYHYIWSTNDDNICKSGQAFMTPALINKINVADVDAKVFNGALNTTTSQLISVSLNTYLVPCSKCRFYCTKGTTFSSYIDYAGSNSSVISHTAGSTGNTLTTWFPRGAYVYMHIYNTSSSTEYITACDGGSKCYCSNYALAAGEEYVITFSRTTAASVVRVMISPYRNISGLRLSFKEGKTWSKSWQNLTDNTVTDLVYYSETNVLKKITPTFALSGDTILYNATPSGCVGWFLSNDKTCPLCFSGEISMASGNEWSSHIQSYRTYKPFIEWGDTSWMATGTRVSVTGMWNSGDSSYRLCGQGFSGNKSCFDDWDFSNHESTYTSPNGTNTIITPCYKIFRNDSSYATLIFSNYNLDITRTTNNSLAIPCTGQLPIFKITLPEKTLVQNVYTITIKNDSTTHISRTETAGQTYTYTTIAEKGNGVTLQITILPSSSHNSYIYTKDTTGYDDWVRCIANVYANGIWHLATPYVWTGSEWKVCT